ncbi:hypothetical protein EB796_019975 [Bugula neritina]|uniref:Uncharacterized protein n=1 Tax=Bugula neritina TaxID=10212 RepID=A0A7J7J7S3_BUGNE|nr:hypothetical protein EB796_019975 [Bugula neritina]
MEKYSRRYSVDAPLPYSGARRQSEPVPFMSSPSSELTNNNQFTRRYSTAQNNPVSILHGRTDANINRSRKYSTNKEVRKLSMTLALQEALAETYGYTPIYGIPIVYTPPPDKLYTSTLQITLSTQK